MDALLFRRLTTNTIYNSASRLKSYPASKEVFAVRNIGEIVVGMELSIIHGLYSITITNTNYGMVK